MDNMDRLLRAAAQGERPHLPQEEVWEALAWAGARKPSPLGRWARYGAMAVAALLLSLAAPNASRACKRCHPQNRRRAG